MADPVAPAAPETLVGGSNGTAAAPTAGAPAKKVSDHLAELRERLPERLRDPRHWADDAEVLIREHPFKTVAGVFLGGIAVGYLLRGRR
jgi:hypothetical protein